MVKPSIIASVRQSEPISRFDAKNAGMKWYFTGEPCLRGHIDARRVSCGSCYACGLDRLREIRLRDPKKYSDDRKAKYADDPSKAKARAALYRKNNPEKARGAVRAWVARNAEYVKLSSRASNKTYRSKNREYYAAHCRNRRAAEKQIGGSHTGNEITELFAKQNGRCANCRTKIGGGYHADHILPVKLGGPNWISNIQLLCAPCNLKKRAKDPFDWARENGRLL